MAATQLVMIGAGNMGEAMLRGILKAKILAPDEVVIVEPADARRQMLVEQLGVSAAATLADAPKAGRYMLAVKPQMMDVVLPELAGAIGADGALVVSIAAGISSGYIAAALGESVRVVRAMPNTPMLVGVGCTGVCRGRGATDDDLAFATDLFTAGGMAVEVDEPAIDAVTAVSGSGPAYFFYLIESMVAAGVAEGLDEQTAQALATQTCLGAAKLLKASGETPAELRAKVTSPGGTTQAAIEAMDAAGAGSALSAAVRAAAARSRELGK